MPNPSDPVARAYAAALSELGREKRQLGAIYDDLRAVLALYEGDAYFRHFFTSPRIDRDVKWNAIRKALDGKVGRPVMGLLRVLVAKGRETAFDNLVRQFERFKDEAENRVHAHLTVAVALDEDARRALVATLERASARTVELHERVDPAVLGGASIRIGDKVIDRTLRTRLAALRRRLASHEPETTTR
jgi:F-type H+-transporting ATPase subunit delta